MDFSSVHIRYFKGYLYQICLQDTIQSVQIVMSSLPRHVAAHATATSAPDHLVWCHGSRGENPSSLLGVWHRRKRPVLQIVDQVKIRIASPGGIAEGVQVPPPQDLVGPYSMDRTRAAQTGQGPSGNKL